MAKTLTIAASNYLPYFKTSTAKVREMLRKTNVINFEAVTDDIANAPQEGAEVVYKDDTRFLFGGFITRVQPTETGKGEHFKYQVEASGYDFIFNNKIVRRAYSNATLAAIVTDIIEDFVGTSYGFDLTNVLTGPTIETVSFDHISVRRAFEKLSKLTGYVWYVDYEKKLYFQTATTTAAPEAITDADDNAEEVQISYDTSQVRNSVIVIGSPDGIQSLDPVTQTFDGDGETRSWELDEKPSQVEYIKLNGVSQQFSLDVNERETDYFVYSFEGKSFKLTEAQTTPVGGGTPDEIEIKYYPRIPIVDQQTDPASIAFFAALDGGDGVYEYTIKDTSIGSTAEATDRAEQELEEYAMPLVEGTIKTRTGLLGAGAIFRPGQVLTVNLPSHGLATDTAFLIQEVQIEVVEGSDTEYLYTLKFGGKIVGVQEFLETLAAQQSGGEEVADATEIITIEHVSDELVFEDDGATMAVESGVYEYGPGGSPQGKWNMSEYA